MDWNFRNDLPIYSQLVEQIKIAIVSGVFPPGMRLSSVRDMAMDAGVNPNTLQRALQDPYLSLFVQILQEFAGAQGHRRQRIVQLRHEQDNPFIAAALCQQIGERSQIGTVFL